MTQNDAISIPPIDIETARISPTDVSQFIRLEQCERYLRLRMHEKSAGKDFISDYGVSAQSLPPLLTLSGGDFEKSVEAAVQARFRKINLAAESTEKRDRPDNNEQTAAAARVLASGEILMLFQVRLHVKLEGWRMNGDADLIRLERDDAGRLHVLIADMKSSAKVKTDHRLQAAFYRAMLAKLFEDFDIEHEAIKIAVLYAGPADAEQTTDVAEVARLTAERAAAEKLFGMKDGYLEIVPNAEDYSESVRDLVTAKNSAARRIASAPFESLLYHLSYKCDGCIYNEFCMKQSAESDDLSLLPHLTANEKKALKRSGISTMRELALLKEIKRTRNSADAEEIELIPAPGKEDLAKKLASTWPVGPRINELVHRARRYRAFKKDSIEFINFIPNKGHGSLPYSDADHNPNLIRIYIDAQYDHLNERIYMLGALIAASENGVEAPKRRRTVVQLTDGPPDHEEMERRLFVRWIYDTLGAVVELAAPDEEGRKRAPIHLIFYDRYEQRLLLDGLARHFSTVLGATPLYDFMTQLAAFDSPVASFLNEEIAEHKNYPMVCQSLQAVAAYLKFDWNRDEKYREIFKERVFDFWGKLDRDGESEWYTNRSRFNSHIPLEYAYAAWERLPEKPSRFDPYAPYRDVTLAQLLGFQNRRLEALEHIAKDFKGNKLTEKQSYDLPDLNDFKDKARTLAAALDEFLTIERHVELNEWKATRRILPERRVLMGETLLVRYCEEDQDRETAERNRENERRRRLNDEYKKAYREKNPQAKRVTLPKDQKAASEWSMEGMRFRLRLAADGLECDLDEALSLSNFEPDKRFIVFPRWTTDERLPIDQRTEFTPTPKQMLYGTRVNLLRFNVKRDENGKAVRGFAEIEMTGKGFGSSERGYVFTTMERPFIENKLYTLDSDPNNIYGRWCAETTEALCSVEEGEIKERNALYDRAAYPQQSAVHWPKEAADGQARFLEGLEALHQAGALHDFEPSKREYIGEHGGDPMLLVQGPPGTGKSYSTAFAVFARIQGAFAAGLDYRVFASCKTHAATDVLLCKILETRCELRELRKSNPEIFDQYIDGRILDAPIFRMAPRDVLPEGIIAIDKDAKRAEGEPLAADRLLAESRCIVGATPGGIRSMLKGKWKKKGDLFGHYLCGCLVLDEASQMNIPEAAMAAAALRPEGQLIVVGDHRQMPPIVHHDWDTEPRRTFQEYRTYRSLFDTLMPLNPPMVKFAESFRLHSVMAEFLRREIYSRDGIGFHSRKERLLPKFEHQDEFAAAVLAPEYPIVVIVHDEAESLTQNEFEMSLIKPILDALADADLYALDAKEGLGVVVPHRMQRALIGAAFPYLKEFDKETGVEIYSAVDTVERFQGGERRVIIVSATESDREYLLASNKFLLDPRRLTVAMSRAKEKMILAASSSIFSLFDADEDTFDNLQMWKNLLRRTCTVKLWEGERLGQRVEVWGGSISS